MEEQDDPFAFLTERCKPTASQEEILRTCPFSRQSEIFPGDSDADSQPPETFAGIPVDPTGIVMVSPPDEFQTPPEDSLPAASSQDQRPPTAVHVAGEENVFSTDAENLSSADTERAVDLSKDSDNIGFSEVNLTEEVVDGLSSSNGGHGLVDACEVFQSESEEFIVLPRESNLAVDDVVSLGSVPKESKLPFISLGPFDPAIARSSTAEKDPVVTDTNRVDDNAMTEVLDLEVEEIGEQLGEDNMFVDLPLKETDVNIGLSEGDEMVRNGNGDMGRKNIEDLDKFRYVNPSGVVKRKITSAGGRRELPPSISKGGKVAAEETGRGNLAAKDKIFKGLLDALKMVAGQLDGGGSEEEGDVDFLETAKRRGMTLPRPRWWPPEGYDD